MGQKREIKKVWKQLVTVNPLVPIKLTAMKRSEKTKTTRHDLKINVEDRGW